MSGFLTAGLISGGLGLAGTIYGANKQEDMLQQSQELPEWLKPYILGDGPTPSYIDNDPLINTNWMDYITRLGNGQQAEWQPMTGNSPFFQPDKTFTPDQGGGPYGTLPQGFDPYGQAPAPQQTGGGMDMDALTSFMERMSQQQNISRMEDMPWTEGQRYNRGFSDMERPEFNQMNKLYELIGRA